MDAPYLATIEATAVIGDYSWALSGDLPPGLQLDTASSLRTVSLSGTPTTAGTAEFVVSVTANGQAAQRTLQVTVGGSGIPPGLTVTDVTVRESVIVPSVKRLGLNVGSQDRWGASKILKNQLPNPGFEPGLFGTLWQADTGSTSGTFRPRYWNTTNGRLAPGFWDGADFEIVYGPGAGTTGQVRRFSHVGGGYEFDLGSGATPLDAGDVMITRAVVPGVGGMNGSAGRADSVGAYSGVQSLRLSAGERFDYYMDSLWRDGDQSSGKLLVVQGDWRVRFHAKAQFAGDQIRVTLLRLDSTPSFLDRTFDLAATWGEHTETRTIDPLADPNPQPWPAGQPRGILSFRVTVPSTNRGDVWIDEMELYRVDDATNPTVFSDRFVDRLLEYRPGVLRFWATQHGDTIENATRPWQTRGTYEARPDRQATRWVYGLHDFLQLCAHVGAEPWYVVPPSSSPADLVALVEYLAGSSGVYARRRIEQGQVAPWTSVFHKITLEFGDELWGGGQPSDPFAGSSVSGGVRLGAIASDRFAIMRQSPLYASVADRIDLTIGGQHGFANRQREIDQNSTEHDAISLGTYFGHLGNWSSNAEVFGPLFAEPFYQAEDPSAPLHLSSQHLRAGTNGTRLKIYEINFHTTQPGTVPASLRNEFVAGASGAVALPLAMLVYLRDLGIVDQCAFTALHYSYKFQDTGSQDDYVQVWGLLRDLYATGFKRPTWLGVEITNRAVLRDLITTEQTGDDPGWTQGPINHIGAPTRCSYIQSFAFQDGDEFGLVLFNIDLTGDHAVRLTVPGQPEATAQLWAVEPNDLHDMNQTSELVTIRQQQLNAFRNGIGMVLPRHSIRVLRWRRSN